MSGFEVMVLCLSLNVYKEARGEPPLGQRAVAHVTINRARESRTDICSVVMAPSQFSWTTTDVRGGVLLPGKRPDRNTTEWKAAEEAARIALYSQDDITRGSTFFHATGIKKPYWTKTLVAVGEVGQHVFYRRK